MNRGLIEQIGTPVQVYRLPRTRFVADFIGRANFIDVTVADSSGDGLVIEVYGQQFRLPNVELSYPKGTKLVLIARPEMLEIGETGQFPGIVRRACYLGNMFDYDVEVAGQLLTVVDVNPHHTSMYSEGAQVFVSLMEDCVHILPG
jgi:iron(III) transport system ATP-binding protein